MIIKFSDYEQWRTDNNKGEYNVKAFLLYCEEMNILNTSEKKSYRRSVNN